MKSKMRRGKRSPEQFPSFISASSSPSQSKRLTIASPGITLPTRGGRTLVNSRRPSATASEKQTETETHGEVITSSLNAGVDDETETVIYNLSLTGSELMTTDSPDSCKDECPLGTGKKQVSKLNSYSYLDMVSSRTSSIFALAEVDSLIDFWMVDEELLGRFQVYSGASTCASENPNPEVVAPAIIFKIKTTSPYNFWVRPIYGLMRPNSVACIQVKCESRAPRTKMEKDEFLVEIAPVPGATAAMTSDLYTSTVQSNLPDLLSIWEKIERESKITLDDDNNSNSAFSKEAHRVTCRFHRNLPILPQTKENGVTDDKDAGTSSESNNNVQRLPHTRVTFIDEREQPNYYLARESYEWQIVEEGGDHVKSKLSSTWKKIKQQEDSGDHPPGTGTGNGGGGSSTTGQKGHRKWYCCCCRCCSTLHCFQFLSLMLALLLIATLCYIYYSQLLSW